MLQDHGENTRARWDYDTDFNDDDDFLDAGMGIPGMGLGRGLMDSDDEYELLCQGIKPWDPEAMDALRVLRGYDDDYESYF